MRKISLDPEALAALNADGAELKAPPKPLSHEVIQVIRRQVAETFFGPLMGPTFKQQLIGYSSFRAIKAIWAADNFQRKYAR